MLLLFFFVVVFFFTVCLKKNLHYYAMKYSLIENLQVFVHMQLILRFIFGKIDYKYLLRIVFSPHLTETVISTLSGYFFIFIFLPI